MAPQYLHAMKIDLSKYMTERYQDSMLKQEYEGPVVTIARDFGCPGRKIAARLTNQLNQLKNSKSKSIRWRWISKEIMAESARELEMDPADIKYVFQYEKKTVFDDIISSQSRKYYKSDRKIRKTVAQVIRNIASEGNVVIVGRGGVAITKDIENYGLLILPIIQNINFTVFSINIFYSSLWSTSCKYNNARHFLIYLFF